MQYADPVSGHVLSLEELETDFKNQLEEGDLWYADLKTKEISWIHEGLDPEKEFDALYTTEPTVEAIGMNSGDDESWVSRAHWNRILGRFGPYAILAAAVAVVALALSRFAVRLKSRKPQG